MSGGVLLHRTIRRFLAAILLLQTSIAPGAESNLWSERRRSLQARTPGGKNLLSDPARVLNALPSVSLSAPSASVRKILPRGDARLASLAAAVSSDGDVRRIFLPRGPATRTVVLLQDVHGNEEAQRHLAALTTSLSALCPLIALEGSSAPLDLSSFRTFPDRDALRDAADEFLKRRWISGPAYASLLSGSAVPLTGVEDPILHAANVEAYRRAVPAAGDIRRRCAERRSALALEKARSFPAPLKALDAAVEAYRDGRAPLGDYARALAAPALPAGFPDVKTFLKALDMEKGLDFDRVQKERTQLLEKLVASLSAERIRALAEAAAAYRAGLMRHGDFYGALQNFCRAANLDLSSYPAVDGYIRYALAADGIDAAALLEQLRKLEESRFAALALTAENKRLIAASRRLWLTGKLLDFSLAPEDWAEYRMGDERDPALAPFQDFYRAAFSRNDAMAGRLSAEMKRRGLSSAVLVAGGFHTDGVAERLVADGAACLVVTPRLTRADAAAGGAYLDVFTREKTPLEKLFAGQKLFLADEPLSPEHEKQLGLDADAKALWNGTAVRTPAEASAVLRALFPEDAEKIAGLSLEKTGGEVVLTDSDGDRQTLVARDSSFADGGAVASAPFLRRWWSAWRARAAELLQKISRPPAPTNALPPRRSGSPRKPRPTAPSAT